MKTYKIILTLTLSFVLAFTGFSSVSGQETASAEGEVSFVKTLFEIPIELPYAGVHYQHKQDAIYVNGNFVMSGECGGGIGAEETSRFASRKPSEGGLWVYSENGEFAEERDVCDETGLVNVGVHHHSIGGTKLWGNSTGFAIQTNFQELGPSNAVMYYTLSGNSLTRQSRILTNDYSLGSPALTNEKLVSGSVFKQNTREHGVAVFDLPGLGEENFIKTQTNITYEPAVALGEHIVGRDNRGTNNENNWVPGVVYRQSGGTIEFVQDLEKVQKDAEENVFVGTGGGTLTSSVPRYAIDYTSGSKRVAFWNQVTADTASSKYLIYEAGSNGLNFVEERSAVWSDRVATWGDAQNNFAVAGDVVAFPTDNGEFEVWENGEKIGWGQLPPTKSYYELNNEDRTGYGGSRGERTPHKLIISPSGNILAMNEFGAYLFKLEGSPVSSPDLPTFDFSPQNAVTLDHSTLLHMAQSYINSLLQNFGTQIQPTTDPSTSSGQATQYTLNRPPQTIAEIRQFQCAYNIVCSGSIETTGYGNLGPLTRAKIEEVFGEGSVQGASISLSNQNQSILDIIIGTLDVTASVLMGVLNRN